jgi:hypothetical protein
MRVGRCEYGWIGIHCDDTRLFCVICVICGYRPCLDTPPCGPLRGGKVGDVSSGGCHYGPTDMRRQYHMHRGVIALGLLTMA